MKRFIPFLLLTLLFFPASVRGNDEGFLQQFIEACELWKVPPKLALAIARQESGFNPWAINVAGKSFLFTTQDDALRMIDLAWSKGASFDIGLMQINSYWMRRFGLNPQFVLEPRNNIILGVWILAQEIERFGLTWEAVASYHTPLDKNPERGRNYAASVIRQMTSNHKER